MPWRLLRRCLLFGLLGLVTSVAVAWGASLHWQLRPESATYLAIGNASADDDLVILFVFRAPGVHREAWIAQPFKDEWLHESARVWRFMNDLVAARHRKGAPISVKTDADTSNPPPLMLADDTIDWQMFVRERFGWPVAALSIQYQEQHTGARPPAGPLDSQYGGVRLHWSGAAGLQPWGPGEAIFLPVRPLPGLLLDTIVYGLLWALVLLAPSALRRRIRRARGRCPKCGYSLAGQAAPGCPECGQGREEVAKWQSGEVAK